ncbi:MAG: LysE family transporter [Bdellovibrionales bacterium]|nr:LysE family transporter [Bdellovibrionales bacterium]
MSESYLHEFLTIAGVHLLAVASPGPDFAIVFRQSVALGRRAGVWTSAGVALGIMLHASYCVIGLGVLLTQATFIFDTLKIIAGCYLCYLGVLSLRASGEPALSGLPSPSRAALPGVAALSFRRGLLTNALNPKVTLFCLALFTVVIKPTTPSTVQWGYAVYLGVATFAWFATLSFFCNLPAIRQALVRGGAWFERVMGAVLLALGVRLVVGR